MDACGQFERHDYAYTVLSRLESALRERVLDRLTLDPEPWEGKCPKRLLEKVERHLGRHPATFPEFLEELQFIDLDDLVLYGSNRPLIIDADSRVDRVSFSDYMGELYSLRCRVAHVKTSTQPLMLTDLEAVFELSRLIAEGLGSQGRSFLEFLKSLDADPIRNVRAMPDSFAEGGTGIVTSQIPTPDYELDGGFVGRSNDIKNVLKLLKSQHRVITISGAGGVGKTALALRVIERVVDGLGPSLDLLVWTSAKNKIMSWSGIESIEQKLSTYENLLAAILETVGLEVPIDGSRLEDDALLALSTADSVLVVIDNLETIEDPRIIEFVLDGPENVRFLVTSRTGIGQVERRYELKQLSSLEAVHLFRIVARQKGLDGLSRASDDAVRRYVERVACYPLAIKWLIAQVALGRGIEASVQSMSGPDSEIAKFCFQQVYESLTPPSQQLLLALGLYGEPTSPGVLKHVSELGELDFEDSVKELLLASLLLMDQVESETGQLETRFSLLALTKGYVIGRLDGDPQMKAMLSRRLSSTRAYIDEAERQRQSAATLRNMGAATEEEKIAAVTAQHAHRSFEAGDYDGAVAQFKRATELAPGLASLYRNWGSVEYEAGHQAEAERLLDKAAALNPEDSVTWGVWGNSRRKAGDYQGAIDAYLRAIALAPNDCFNLVGLAQTHIQRGDYELAEDIGKQAVAAAIEAGNERNETVARTVLANMFDRRAFDHARSGHLDAAMECLRSEKAQLDLAFAVSPRDGQLLEQKASMLTTLANVHFRRGEVIEAEAALREGVRVTSNNNRTSFHFARFSYQLAKSLSGRGAIEDASSVLQPSVITAAEKTSLSGDIAGLRRMLDAALATSPREGFICHVGGNLEYVLLEDDGDGEVFFAHMTRFVPMLSPTLELARRRVRWWPAEGAHHSGQHTPVLRAELVD